MTNQQMIEFINYQNRCFKFQDGNKQKSHYLEPGNIFNCPVDEDEFMKIKMERTMIILSVEEFLPDRN